jgi:cytidine deaminase
VALSSEQQELISAAISAMDGSHPDNPPNLHFGAAARSESGAIYASSAFWSVTLALALHGEQAALAHAAAHSDRRIVAIACVSSEDPAGKRYCHPCGICKQLMYENATDSGIDMEVLMANLEGDAIVRRISEIVPFPWPSPA